MRLRDSAVNCVGHRPGKRLVCRLGVVAESPSTPTSFSTCIISTVWSRPSTSLMCRISAAKARASASSVAAHSGAQNLHLAAVLDHARKAPRILLTHTGA